MGERLHWAFLIEISQKGFPFVIPDAARAAGQHSRCSQPMRTPLCQKKRDAIFLPG